MTITWSLEQSSYLYTYCGRSAQGAQTRLCHRTQHEHTCLRVNTRWDALLWRYQPPRVWNRDHAGQSVHYKLSSLASPSTSMGFSWILFFVLVRMTGLATAGISDDSLCTRLDPALYILVKLFVLLGKYLLNTRVTFDFRRAWYRNNTNASTYTWSLPHGQVMTQRSAETS